MKPAVTWEIVRKGKRYGSSVQPLGEVTEDTIKLAMDQAIRTLKELEK